jgi:hypothetical protein
MNSNQLKIGMKVRECGITVTIVSDDAVNDRRNFGKKICSLAYVEQQMRIGNMKIVSHERRTV